MSSASRPDTDSLDAHRLRLRSPQDLVEMVPYLLGFHPTDSIVVVAVEGGAGELSRIGVVARIDRLPLENADQTLDHVFAAVCRSGAHRVVAVWYGSAVHERELDELHRAAGRAACELFDVLCVTEGRWRSLVCDDERCCPADGRPVPETTTPIAAAAAYAGLVARPDRSAVTALLDPAPAADRERLRPAVSEAERRWAQRVTYGQKSRQERSAVRALFAASRVLGVLTDAEVGRYGVALRQIPVRDSCWLAVDEQRITGESLWRELARRLPAPYDAAPLFLFGWLQWRDGNGTLASTAAARALESEPDYSAAVLLNAAVQQGLNPFQTPRLRRYRR